jgi:hypothetical protein
MVILDLDNFINDCDQEFFYKLFEYSIVAV